jgi:hypothetical protein
MSNTQPPNLENIILVHDQLPAGPLAFLNNTDQTIFTYEDYDNKLTFVLLPFSEKLKITYFLPVRGSLECLLQAVSAFNLMNAEIEIYCHEHLIGKVREYSNEHLSFRHLESGVTEIPANVIVTYALGALYFIKQRMPVMIIGPNGLGGWVTPENFPYLQRDGFMGRPGGELWERIPSFVVMEELLSIKNCTNLDDILRKNSELADRLPYVPRSKTGDVLEELSYRQSLIYSEKDKWLLKPTIATNIRFVQDSGTVYVRREYINDTIASFEASDFGFFKSINGKHDFQQLYQTSNMEQDDFWELVYALIEKKIISFR